MEKSLIERSGRMGAALVVIAFLGPLLRVSIASADSAQPSTRDLMFLLGHWDVERRWEPGSDRERIAQGTLSCESVLDDAYIRCRYSLTADDRPPINEVVYLNFNGIYGRYESLWISASWPIKNTMSATPAAIPGTLRWTSEFLIENGVTERVQTLWNIDRNTVERRVEIQTSQDPANFWLFWLQERLVRHPAL
ncbi:MAG: hypothetical protein AAGL66_09865 [Pseudomonadota bacterium]